MDELYNNYFNIQSTNIWKVAIYVRLSREDEKDENYRGQSESIENQIKFLKPIVKSKGWILVDIYKDDGYTGTNFDRPDFKRLLDDIDKGIINLVITKDLSRLGRDYIETGRYIEKVFPSKNIRYIAVNDNIDTFDRRNTNNDMTPFKSVMNDLYAKDISNKVRTAISTKAREGDCIKSFLPYGYKKDENDKNKILIDTKVSDVVALIFELYKSGKNKTAIANILNERQIMTPLKYKEQTTNYFNPNKNNTYKWNSTIITKILRDRIYVGDLVQLKYSKVNYKIHKTVKVPEAEHIIIQNHHPAIVERNVFNTVQEMLDKKSNEWNFSGRKRHLLSGLVYCTCGSRITYNLNHGKFSRCVCSSYKKYGNKFCHNIHLREDELIRLTAESLNNNIKQYLNIKDLKYKTNNLSKKDFKKDLDLIAKKQDELNKIIANLYEDKISNVISEDTFKVLIRKYETQKKEFEKKLENIKREEKSGKQEEGITKKDLEATMNYLLDFKSIDDDNVSLVFKLIDKIIINDNKIKINYKFKV